jgi:uncharacterized protein YjaG (DUF416 family)
VNMGRERKRQAIELDSEVRQLVHEVDTLWLRVGRLCERCRSERLYQELGLERFDDWIRDAVGWSRSRAYVAMRAARDLVPIRDAELDRMTMQNADILSRVPKSKQAALVEAAVIQTEREFRKTVEKTVPGLHLEDMVHVEFWVPRSLAEVIERCIEKAKVLNETDSRTAAVEAIFAEYDIRHADPEKEREAERQEVS